MLEKVLCEAHTLETLWTECLSSLAYQTAYLRAFPSRASNHSRRRPKYELQPGRLRQTRAESPSQAAAPPQTFCRESARRAAKFQFSYAVFRGSRRFCCDTVYVSDMPERDTNQEALEHVEKITDSEPVKGEDLLASEEAKRQLREAKQRLSSEQE